MHESIGSDFFQGTRYHRDRVPNHFLDWDNKPETFKIYPEAERIELPAPIIQDGPGIWEVIHNRRSRRAYTDEPLNLSQLSQLLWATQGVTGEISIFKLRTAPSAGALYPIETYLYANRVTGLEKGLYHYNVQFHHLELIKKGDFSNDVKKGALDQGIAGQAAVVFIWSAVFERSTWKYLQRAYRYIFLDAAHIAQNLALATEALGLGSCQIGAIYDEEMNSLLNLDSNKESVIYLSSVGIPRRG